MDWVRMGCNWEGGLVDGREGLVAGWVRVRMVGWGEVERREGESERWREESVAPLSGLTRSADPNRIRDSRLIIFIYFSFGYFFF